MEGKEALFLTSAGRLKELGTGHATYNLTEVMVRRATLMQLKSSGTKTVDAGDDFKVVLSTVEVQYDEVSRATKKCYIATRNPADDKASLYLCTAGNRDFGPGETLQLAGNVGLIDVGDKAECVCARDGAVIDCGEF